MACQSMQKRIDAEQIVMVKIPFPSYSKSKGFANPASARIRPRARLFDLIYDGNSISGEGRTY